MLVCCTLGWQRGPDLNLGPQAVGQHNTGFEISVCVKPTAPRLAYVRRPDHRSIFDSYIWVVETRSNMCHAVNRSRRLDPTSICRFLTCLLIATIAPRFSNLETAWLSAFESARASRFSFIKQNMCHAGEKSLPSQSWRRDGPEENGACFGLPQQN